MHRKQKVIVIRHSCLTGKVVWIYRGPSKAAARTAYCRACKREVERVRHWNETSAQRRFNIMHILNECLEDLGITDSLTKKQSVAAKKLRTLTRKDIACHREFYEHIMEERRRREEDKKIWAQMRVREKSLNSSYV